MHWQSYQSEVERAIASLGSKSQNILVFYGEAGIGKKQLCDEIFKSLNSQHLCALLDGVEIKQAFSESLQKAVLRLRKHFNRAKAGFTCFDLAYFQYLCRVDHNPPKNSAEFSRRMDFAEITDNVAELINSFLDDFKDLSIPVIQPLAKLTWLCMRLSNPDMWEWYRKSQCRERLQKLTEYVRASDILQQLPLFLADDLREYLKRRDIQAAKQKAVILVDTYQDLVDESGRCSWLDKLLKQPNSDLLWVIFSDQALKFTADTQNIPILPLTEAESQAFLADKGVIDEEIRQIIVEAAAGLPFYLQVGVETWEEIKNKRQPQAEDFARNLQEALPKGDAAIEPDERRMWQVLANCRTWDEALFTKLMVQFQLESWQNRFAKVTASPYVEEINSGLWRLHPLMRQYRQENQLEDLQKSVNSWLFEHYQAEYQNPDLQLTALGEALYHGLASQQPQQAMTWFLEQVAVQQQQGRHQAMIAMLKFFLQHQQDVHPTTALAKTLLGESLLILGEYEEAVTVLETAQNQWQTLQLSESLDAATGEFHLAGVYLKLERTFDADKAVQKAFAIRTVQLGANSPAVAEVLNRQAEIAASQGNYRQAVNLSQQALQILQSHPDTQPLQLAQLKYTAVWLNAYNNNLDVAETLCQEALAIVKNAVNDEHPLAISCQALLGNIYEQMGQHKYQKAFNQYQLALDSAEISLGPSHPQTLDMLNALTRLCRKAGQYDKAEEFAKRHNQHVQLGKFEETAETARRLNNLGFALYKKGEYGKAEPLWKQALQINMKVLGAEHPDTTQSLHNLALLYYAQGRYEAAEPLYTQALKIRRKVLGKEHPDTTHSLNNLALLYYVQGRYKAAEPLYNQALQIYRQVLGEEHRDTATSLNNLALLYYAKGRYTEAEPLYIQALNIRRKVLGEEHPDTAQSLHNLAVLYYTQGRYEAAEHLYNQALQIRMKMLGAEHPGTSLSLDNLATLYESQGRYEAAEHLYNQALQIRMKMLGVEHPDTANSLNNLATLYKSQGRYAEAEPLYNQALQIKMKLLGVEHPDTALSLNNLAALYESQGRYTEAEPLYNQALQIRMKLLGAEHPDTKAVEANLSRLRDEMKG